jgi:hypothetical protein
MANQILGPPWSERVVRLRLGIAAHDALGRPGPLGGLGLYVEDVPRPWPVPKDPGVPPGDDAGLPGIPSAPSGRFALRFGRIGGTARASIVVRVTDRQRRYVPRRFSVPAPDEAAVVAADAANSLDPTLPLIPRAFRPALFPGAAYGAAAGATVLRGVVLAAGTHVPVPWARVEARTAQPIDVVDDNGDVVPIQPVLGRAHGDDRGEFLLVVGSLPRDVVVTSVTPDIELEVRVRARPQPVQFQTPDSPLESPSDPLWQLPIEVVPDLGPDNGVTLGAADPPGYTATASQVLSCRRGSATRPAIPFIVS